MNNANLYGEFENDSSYQKEETKQPEVKIVQIKSESENIPFRWKVASNILSSIIQNHEYSKAISNSLASKGNVSREAFQDEVSNISINFADVLITKLENSTIKKELLNG